MTSSKPQRFKDLIMQLFLLHDPYLEEKAGEEYFDRNSMDKFVDLLEQLALKSPKRDEFIKWILDLVGKKDLTLTRKQFQEWMQVEENKKKDYRFIHDAFSDDDRFYIWLEDYCEVSPDSKRIRIETTNSEVWDILCEAKRRGFFSTESLGDLIHFRQVVIDCFYLLDDDDDKKLRKCSVDSDLDIIDGDLNDEFW